MAVVIKMISFSYKGDSLKNSWNSLSHGFWWTVSFREFKMKVRHYNFWMRHGILEKRL